MSWQLCLLPAAHGREHQFDRLPYLLQTAAWSHPDEARRLLADWLAEVYCPAVANHEPLVTGLLDLLRRNGWRAAAEVIAAWERMAEALPEAVPLGVASDLLGVRHTVLRRWLVRGWLEAMLVQGEGFLVPWRPLVPLAWWSGTAATSGRLLS